MKSETMNGYGGAHLETSTFGSQDNPPVLLIPGTGQTKEMWQGAAEALADAGRYAICIDPRGHGGSDRSVDGHYDLSLYAADLTAVLTQLSSRAAVVGVGASGLAAMVAVGEGAPGLASALVLVGVTAWPDENIVERTREAMALQNGPFTDEIAALQAIGSVYPLEPAPASTVRLINAFERGGDGLYHWRCDPGILSAIDFARDGARIESAAAALKLPVLLVRGTLNRSVSEEAQDKLHAMIPGSETQEIEGSGHHVATDRGDAFNAGLLDFLERAAPRQALIFRGGSEPRLLRDALGCFGTGVTIVTTTDAEGQPIGLTVNSFTSVSLSPPLILFCLAKTSGSLGIFQTASGFAINVLHIGQQPASNRFARRDGARFEGVDWEYREPHGSPILNGSLASFDCTVHAVHDGGDHLIFIGEVQHAYFEPHRDPLLYFHGKYRRIHLG